MRHFPLAATIALAFALGCCARPCVARAAADSLAAAPAARVRAWQCGLLRADRLQHASLSFTLAAGAGVAGARALPAFGGTLALGLAKELLDARRTRFDPADLAADLAGAALGASVARSAGP